MYVETSDMIGLRSKWDEAGVTSSPLFFGITPAQKNYSGVYLVLCDSHPNIIETVTAPSHPTMYIQPNTPFVTNAISADPLSYMLFHPLFQNLL
jgi:hypothetical protein